jgi:hypothetical protein
MFNSIHKYCGRFQLKQDSVSSHAQPVLMLVRSKFPDLAGKIALESVESEADTPSGGLGKRSQLFPSLLAD